MITPVEIRQHTFHKSLRGYDPDEVNAFLSALAGEWDKTLETNRQLREQLAELQTRYDGLREVESMLHKTLHQAEHTSRVSLENAKQKADIRLREAEIKAQEIVRKGMEERQRLDQEVSELSARKEELLMQLKLFLNTQLERLRSLEHQDLPVDTAAQFAKTLVNTSPNTVEEQMFGVNDAGRAKQIFDEIAQKL